jgi:hypothetical protein
MNDRIALSSVIYPPECLRRAAAAYQGLCSVEVVEESPVGCLIEIHRAAHIVDGRRLINEFLNYLLDLSLEKHLAEYRGGDGTNRVSAA